MSDPIPPASSTYDLRPLEVFMVQERPRRRYWLHGLLLLATIFTTLVVGARLEFNFLHDLPAFSLDDSTLPLFPLRWVVTEPSRLLLGVPFAGTLLLILLSHEMGHYLYCMRYGVNATLPFFIPAPTLIGTLGAFIRIKSPIRSREALFDIGVAGPIAGFVVAFITLVAALGLSKPLPPGMPSSDIVVGYPLVFHLAHRLLGMLGVGPGKIPLPMAYLHPTAIAAWVGMFATALNLLPGGQLDGGHMVYALSPRLHKHVSRLTVGILLPMGFFLWAGWFVWALLLTLSGVRHPVVPAWPGLRANRKLLALMALAMLILTFVPEPLKGAAFR
ncbi:MAG TPA: site-2 protease family protein [Terriglobales bacterium]|jgi:membrane-associated protease RseP (regulator of RpoE activity)|nr:site-2 protease family protein [Terriglobales bacterium]